MASEIRGCRFLPASICMLAGLITTSCFTGIESTKKVELGREERRMTQPTEEEKFFQLERQSIKEWEPGREYLATDDRLAYVMDIKDRNPGESISLKGKILRFISADNTLMPDQSKEASIVFECEGRRMVYPTGKDYIKAIESFSSLDLPMMIDLKMVEEADRKLRGLHLWTKSPLWYDGDSTRIKGRKFVAVDVTRVTPGETTFPLRVYFRDSSGKESFMLMNIGNGGHDSRSFSNLFSLSDIRKQYPKITDGVWEKICAATVVPGMTKEECKLALGNPTDVNSGHSYSQTLDIWSYPDGKVLRFADGLLVDFGIRGPGNTP